MGDRVGKDYHFTVIIEKEEEGGFHAFCPSLPGCHTQGETFEEAMNNIKDAVKLYLESLLAHNESIPEEDITIKSLKVAM